MNISHPHDLFTGMGLGCGIAGGSGCSTRAGARAQGDNSVNTQIDSTISIDHKVGTRTDQKNSDLDPIFGAHSKVIQGYTDNNNATGACSDFCANEANNHPQNLDSGQGPTDAACHAGLGADRVFSSYALFHRTAAAAAAASGTTTAAEFNNNVNQNDLKDGDFGGRCEAQDQQEGFHFEERRRTDLAVRGTAGGVAPAGVSVLGSDDNDNCSSGCETVRLTCEGSLSETNISNRLNRIIRNLKSLLLPKPGSSYSTRGKFNVITFLIITSNMLNI